jgi:hypothetical protein
VRLGTERQFAFADSCAFDVPEEAVAALVFRKSATIAQQTRAMKIAYQIK